MTQISDGDTSVPRKVRIQSLDWTRGWMLVASVTVNSWVFMPEWFQHAPWFGVHPVDVIFPIFVTLSGVDLALPQIKKKNVGGDDRVWS